MQRSTTRSFFAGAAGALLVLAAAAVIVPQYGDYTARSRASEALYFVRSVQDQVEAQAIAHQSVSGSGVGISSSSGPAVSEVLVLSNGVILLRAAHFGQVFVLIPSYSEGKVAWHCIGGSSKDVPAKCRG